jgi:hypothetical protein
VLIDGDRHLAQRTLTELHAFQSGVDRADSAVDGSADVRPRAAIDRPFHRAPQGKLQKGLRLGIQAVAPAFEHSDHRLAKTAAAVICARAPDFLMRR